MTAENNQMQTGLPSLLTPPFHLFPRITSPQHYGAKTNGRRNTSGERRARVTDKKCCQCRRSRCPSLASPCGSATSKHHLEAASARRPPPATPGRGRHKQHLPASRAGVAVRENRHADIEWGTILSGC